MRQTIFLSLFMLYSIPAWAGVSILDYNVAGIGYSGNASREALQRIVDYHNPDIIIFQEAKGTGVALGCPCYSF